MVIFPTRPTKLYFIVLFPYNISTYLFFLALFSYILRINLHMLRRIESSLVIYKYIVCKVLLYAYISFSELFSCFDSYKTSIFISILLKYREACLHSQSKLVAEVKNLGLIIIPSVGCFLLYQN